MTVAEAMRKMILLSDANFHDINHFLKVHAYALTIGACEGLSQAQRYTLELAAIVHDIACPLCREKYGNTNGKYQEQEGIPLVRAFLSDTGLSPEQIERVAYLVGHHHTYINVDGADYQILLEADYIANASENSFSRQSIETFLRRVTKTESGIRLARSILLS